jgi:hypothetical protein
MNLLEQFERIKSKQKSIYQPGYVQRIFEIHANNEKDESGQIPIIIKLESEEKKKKRSIN